MANGDKEKQKSKMDGLGITLAINALKAISFLCDILTFPIYLVLQRPWRKRSLSKRIKAVPVELENPSETKICIEDGPNNPPSNGDTRTQIELNNKAAPCESTRGSITYHCVDNPGEYHIQLVRNNIDTMEKMFRYISKINGEKRCLGTRQILNEEDEVQPNGRVFKKYNMGDYIWKTYSEVDNLATSFGRGLREFGAKPRENVVIFAETRAEWMIAAQGLFKQSIPIVTIYATLGEEAIAHGINETEVTMIITSHDLLPKFKSILKNTPKVKTIIYMEDQLNETDTKGFKDGVKIIPYKEVIARGLKSTVECVPPGLNEPAIIMYTSGSTGIPKGVILTHYNLITTIKAFCDRVTIYRDDVLLGFLPLAHVFELLSEHVCLLVGVPIGYSTPLTMIDSSSKIKRGTKGDAAVLRPSCMTAVPLIMDRISKGIQEKVSKGSFISKVLFKFAYEYKAKWMKRGYGTPLLDKIVFSKVKSLLGGRVRLLLTGGAPLSPDTHEQMQVCLCVKVIQGYGLTESTSCATVMDGDDITHGRVGAPTSMTQVRLIDWEEGNYRITDKPYPRGEVLIGGDHIAIGYYKLPDKTAEEFFEESGKRWFRTGDIGEVHPDGCLKIIDRKKDLVKLQAGEYVSLGKIESELKTCPLVENICVYGDSTKHFTVALVVPNPQQLSNIAAKHGVASAGFEELCSNPAVEKAVIQELADHAKKCKLEKFEVPAAVKLCKEVWTPDMGLVTAAFKLKRKDIQERYQFEINRMYAS